MLLFLALLKFSGVGFGEGRFYKTAPPRLVSFYQHGFVLT